ncbi:unnamed protein product, partial [Darwinula stevensoni]
LSKHFGTQKAVDNLSFEAHPGQILGFLGPNGAGKTTTMKMLCCYTEPTEGTASVEGYDVKTSPLLVRKQIGYLPEHNPLYEEISLIKELGKEKTVIFSSHIMQEVQALCDRVVIINNGNLVADESIDTLRNRMEGNRSVRVEFAQK